MIFPRQHDHPDRTERKIDEKNRSPTERVDKKRAERRPRERAGKQWRDASWERRGDQWVLIDGTWLDAGAAVNAGVGVNVGIGVNIGGGGKVRFPSAAPPALRDERPGVRAGSVWVRGRWDWRDGNWTWVNGRWERERAAHEEKAKLAKLLTDQKAARDARYAARKKRQK